MCDLNLHIHQFEYPKNSESKNRKCLKYKRLANSLGKNRGPEGKMVLEFKESAAGWNFLEAQTSGPEIFAANQNVRRIGFAEFWRRGYEAPG